MLNRLCKKLVVFSLISVASFTAQSADNLILITLDGVRWQDVYQGMDNSLFAPDENPHAQKNVQEKFADNNANIRRKKLMPFLWSKVASEGLLLGNQDADSVMRVSNKLWFSYPGYNELLTGKPDPKIRSNTATNNNNVTFLEWLNNQKVFKNKVAAFGSWDVFPAIINETRSNIPVNAGFESAKWPELSDRAKWLNRFQELVPSPWHNVRLDAFTMHYALDYIDTHTPRVVYISLGETDDFAHQGSYWQYLLAMERADTLIKMLWEKLQSKPEYAGKTNLIITTDHGRGNTLKNWPHHGSAIAMQGYLSSDTDSKQGIIGSDSIWLAALGPAISQKRMQVPYEQGELANTEPASLSQVAATVLALLNIDHTQYADNIAAPIREIAP